VVDVQGLDGTEEGTLRLFHLNTTPPIDVCPQLLTSAEVAHLLAHTIELGIDGAGDFSVPLAGAHPFVGATSTISVLQKSGTEVLASVEQRLASLGGANTEELASLRVVRPGCQFGLSNRGCGAKSCYVCLSDYDEVIFPHQALRVLLRRGDALCWPNTTLVSSEGGGAFVEDMRTVHAHLRRGVRAVGLDAHFHAPRVPSRASPPKIAVGDKLEVDGCVCVVTAPIGQGSFGTVWCARAQDVSDDVVVKEMFCQLEASESTAYEANLLRQLGELRRTCTEGELERVPTFVAREVQTVDGYCRVFLVMSRLPGESLETHQASKTKATTTTGERERALEACRFSWELLRQLAPTLEAVGQVAYHRDVNSRNVTVSVNEEGEPRFGLVDFGLAVDRSVWHGSAGEHSWHNEQVGGDCRYWPPSAWHQMLQGPTPLLEEPSLLKEYTERLDHFALGLLAVQVLCDSLDRFLEPAVVGDSVFLRGLTDVRHAWGAYWAEVSRFWKQLFAVFSSGCDAETCNAVKLWCIQEGAMHIIGRNVENLRSSACEAARACHVVMDSDDNCEVGVARALFLAVQVLLTTTVTENAESAQDWRRVIAVLSDLTVSSGVA